MSQTTCFKCGNKPFIEYKVKGKTVVICKGCYGMYEDGAWPS